MRTKYSRPDFGWEILPGVYMGKKFFVVSLLFVVAGLIFVFGRLTSW